MKLLSITILSLYFATFAAAQSIDTGTITVGVKLLISKEMSNRPQWEPIIAVDPANSQNMMACWNNGQHDSVPTSHTIVYSSFDGGKRWKKTLDIQKPGSYSCDPACAYGPGGVAFAWALGTPIYRSVDAGRTWSKFKELGAMIDRPTITIDNNAKSAKRGTVYFQGKSFSDVVGDSSYLVQGTDVWRFKELSQGLLGPARIVDGPGFGNYPPPTKGAILSDGEYFSVIGLVPDKADSNVLKSKIVVLRLGKDGRRFLPSVIVSDWLSSGGMLFDNASGPMPTIAADTMSDRFKDRLYVTWPDMKKDSASIFVAYSSDKGESWSKPVLVSSPEVMGSESDGFHSCPTVAVNRAGILGLIWHRGVHHADLGRSPLQDNISHQTWFTASLDGGETFLPAVKLSKNDLPKRFRIGEALGLDVDSKGNFHAAWVENRTGNPQIYYAPITVTVSQSQLNPVIGSPDTTNKEGIDKIYKDEILPLIVRKEVIDWDSLEKQLTTKHGRSIGLEVVSLARPPYHYTRFEWEKFQSSLSTHIRRYGTASFSSVTFNNFAYAIFLHFGDKKILEEAANWSLKTIQELEDPEYLDTYASILYRMGKTRVAIEWQEKALTKAGDEGTRKRFQTAIDKMKRGEPTWPVPEQPKK